MGFRYRYLLAGAALVALVASGVAVAAQDGKGEALVQQKCTPCHGLDVTCGLLGKRDRDGWDWTISEMQRKGAKVGVDEKRVLTDYLAALAPGSAPVCPQAKKPEPKKPEGDDPEALVMNVCTRCHDTRRICKNLRVKGKDGWDKTVTMMMFNGAPIDVAQKEIIVNYLFTRPAGAKPICP